MSSPPHDELSDDDEPMYPLTRHSRPILPPSSPSPSSLQWTQQLRVYPLPNDTSDKILLPATALEQLLASLPFNTDLPHPLTFRITNPKTSHSTHVGVREFSAPADTIGIPSWITESLEIHSDDTVTVSIRILPKATRVKLRPLEAGYIEDDWKALLESQLRTHTTLTKGQILSIRAGVDSTFRFLIDELEPADAVNLIDTDVSAEIEEMSEDNARHTQNQRIQAAKQKNAEITDITIEKPIHGKIVKGEYVYFRMKQWEKSRNLEITLTGMQIYYCQRQRTGNLKWIYISGPTCLENLPNEFHWPQRMLNSRMQQSCKSASTAPRTQPSISSSGNPIP